MVAVRYESSLSNFFTMPFEVGLRHLKVACCDGSQETLIKLARERMIYRPLESNNNEFKQLTFKERFYHGLVGLSETVGYLTIIAPFVIAVADRAFYKPLYPKGGHCLRRHMEEGGKFEDFSNLERIRSNPFELDGVADPFYQGASWLLPKMSSSQIDSLLAKAEIFVNNSVMDTSFFTQEQWQDILFTYIKNIINNPNFQEDPKAFMQDWKSKRGYTEEYRFPEDRARTFFSNAFYNAQK